MFYVVKHGHLILFNYTIIFLFFNSFMNKKWIFILKITLFLLEKGEKCRFLWYS